MLSIAFTTTAISDELTSSRQTTNTNVCITASNDGQIGLGQLAVNSMPGVARLNGHGLLVCRQMKAVEVLQGHGDATLDAGRSCESSMAPALDGKGTLRKS